MNEPGRSADGGLLAPLTDSDGDFDYVQRKVAALLEANQAILQETDFATCARRIFDACRQLTGATSGYVALLSPDGAENEVLFLEAGGLPCSVDSALPMPIRGLRAEAYRDKRTVYDNDFARSHWMEFMPAGHVRLENVLFAPLQVDGVVVGLMGVANKPSPFTPEDAESAGAFGKLAALALRNSRTRERLACSQQLLAATGRVARVGGWELDLRAGTVRWTDEMRRIHGVAPGYVPDVDATVAFYDEEHRPLIRAAVEQIVDEGGAFERELRITTARGRQRWVQVRGQAVGEPGAVHRIFGTLQDITRRRREEEQRQQLEAKIQQTQKLESLGVLAGGIAHDFNNLLMAMLGNVSLAQSMLSPASPVREFLDEVETAAQRAADLSRQMLAYSGKGALAIENLDLNEVVQEMGHLLEVSVSKTVVLKYDLTPKLPPVRGDATQLRQILMNLITNASEAIGDSSGLISLRTAVRECDRDYLAGTYLDDSLPAGLYVELEVSDTGCGMDEATRQRLFDPFFSTKFTGRGLGLAAVLGIVRGHQGAIKVYSEPEQGTSIKVLLPAREYYLHTDEAPAKEPTAWRGEGRVLLVDDDESARTVGRRILQHLGFEVELARDGREGVQRYRELSADLRLVVLDLTMPHMDGRQAFSEMQRLDPTVPIVLTSGYSVSEIRTRLAGRNLAGYIQKPYDVNVMRELLRGILEPEDD